MRPRRTTGILLTLTASAVLGSVSVAQESAAPRRWTSADGRQSVMALLVQYDPTAQQVTLRDALGAEIQLPLRQLSSSDRRYLRNLSPDPVVADGSETESPDLATPSASKRRGKANRNLRGGTELWGIRWQPDWNQALAEASGNAGTEDDRPIMLFRVLGDLSGFM